MLLIKNPPSLPQEISCWESDARCTQGLPFPGPPNGASGTLPTRETSIKSKIKSHMAVHAERYWVTL